MNTYTVTTYIPAAASFPVAFGDDLSAASDFFGDEVTRLKRKGLTGVVTLWEDGEVIDRWTVS